LAQLFLRRQADVVWREIDSYGVLLKVNTGDYCELNEVGLFIWQQLEQESTLDDIASRVAREFDTGAGPVMEDVLEFARDLAGRGMLVIDERQ
jgi:hypothetical protein